MLKRLKNELDRGEVDPQLLEELGWTPDDMQKFVQRMEAALQTDGRDQSPAAEARRKQFEATLESLQLKSDTGKRQAKPGRATRAGEIGGRSIPVPAEYRELYEAYTRSLSKQGTAPAPKAAPAPPK